MKVHLKSNFVVPGVKHDAAVEIDQPAITLREFLHQLSKRAPNNIEYVKSGTGEIDPYEWEVKINDIPYQHCEGHLEALLRDGDIVTLNIIPIGGG